MEAGLKSLVFDCKHCQSNLTRLVVEAQRVVIEVLLALSSDWKILFALWMQCHMRLAIGNDRDNHT